MKTKIILTLIFTSLIIYPPLSHSQDYNLDPSRVKWKSLYYKTYVLLFSFKVRAKLNIIHSANSTNTLLTSKQGQGTFPRMNPSYRIDLNSKFLNRDSLTSLWFDPDGTAFQRTQTETGSKKRIKIYRILKNGFYSLDIKPKENEKDLPPEKWTLSEEGFRTFKMMPPDGTVVTEPTALYYIVSASYIDRPGDKFEKHIFTKYGIYKLSLFAVGYREIETDFESINKGEKKTFNRTVKTLHIKMSTAPIDSTQKNEFEFLGLKKDIDLYLDPATRVLTQISGKADKIGYADIKLKEVIF